MITASTGIAACHIGGTTVHSFAGVGLAKEKLSELEAKVKKNRTCSRRWQECRVLVVDEHARRRHLRQARAGRGHRGIARAGATQAGVGHLDPQEPGVDPRDRGARPRALLR
eukprot:scaffold17078_cov65-Phaeocystis_antarctica.AAC.9